MGNYTEEELIYLGNKYISEKKDFYLADVDVEKGTIKTYYHGCYLTHDAKKIDESFGYIIKRDGLAV